jgi:hypothetical protein
MNHYILYGFLFILIIAVISLAWASAIEKMRDEHPDYKGEDMFNEKE